nr:hydroxymethylglutaryl-coa lyase, mitochondrial [Quercus suber]
MGTPGRIETVESSSDPGLCQDSHSMEQMAASDRILSSLLTKPPSTPSGSPMTYQWLLPNSKGLDNYLKTMDTTFPATPPASPTIPPDASAPSSSPGRSDKDPMNLKAGHRHEISIFLAATETFSQKNTNCSIQESLTRFAPLMSTAKTAGFPVRAYISVALGCPFEGPNTDPHKVADLAGSLLEMGADEISVADTTGMGTAPRTRKLLQTLRDAGIRADDLALHFHDTFGQALVNTMVGLDFGVRTFDAAVGGLGGCPYSPGATGNLATEDLIYFVESLGASTGVDLEEVSRIGDWITSEIGKGNASSAGRATMARLRREHA